MAYTTYSFADVNAAISGAGGSFSLSNANVADEGISVEFSDDRNTMTTGATRGGMHSYHMSRSGRVTIRLLKNSPTIRQLMDLFRRQEGNSALWGNNTITITNQVTQDTITCAQCAFMRVPTINYAKDGGTMEWVFESTDIDVKLGDGIAVV